MRIFAISGDGIGAGKSTLAAKLSARVWSFATEMREELQRQFPKYDWFNRTQEYKDGTTVTELGKTVRQVLIEYGQQKCASDALYWARLLADRIALSAPNLVAIDDLRKMCEIHHLRERFGEDVTHIHVVHAFSKPEPEFENDLLADAADYIISRKLTDAELDACTEALSIYGEVDTSGEV